MIIATLPRHRGGGASRAGVSASDGDRRRKPALSSNAVGFSGTGRPLIEISHILKNAVPYHLGSFVAASLRILSAALTTLSSWPLACVFSHSTVVFSK